MFLYLLLISVKSSDCWTRVSNVYVWFLPKKNENNWRKQFFSESFSTENSYIVVAFLENRIQLPFQVAVKSLLQCWVALVERCTNWRVFPFYFIGVKSKKFLKAINSYCWFNRQTNTRTKTKRTFYYLASTEGKPRQWCTTLSSRLDTESLSTFVRLDEKKVFLPFFISYYVVLKFSLGIIQALFVLSICSFFFHLSYDYFSLFV